jgi:hypothetical protein
MVSPNIGTFLRAGRKGFFYVCFFFFSIFKRYCKTGFCYLSREGQKIYHKAVFSFTAGNRRISPAIAIKSPAMNFPSMGLMFKNKLSCLFYFNSVSLSFAGMYSRSEHGII